MLELKNVSSGYGEALVLNKVNITVEENSITCILGSNGVGKTTTLRTIMGILNPNEGTISYKGKNISGFPPHKTANLDISYSPEGRKIFGNLTVFENLRLGAYRLKSKNEFKTNLEEVYNLFPILKERKNQISENLSGGEQQMLALGRAFISNPELVLLDEPSLGLAPNLISFVSESLVKINENGVSILLVEQNCNMALNISDYGYVMEKGCISMEGSSEELMKDEKIKNVYLGICEGEE